MYLFDFIFTDSSIRIFINPALIGVYYTLIDYSKKKKKSNRFYEYQKIDHHIFLVSNAKTQCYSTKISL